MRRGKWIVLATGVLCGSLGLVVLPRSLSGKQLPDVGRPVPQAISTTQAVTGVAGDKPGQPTKEDDQRRSAVPSPERPSSAPSDVGCEDWVTYGSTSLGPSIQPVPSNGSPGSFPPKADVPPPKMVKAGQAVTEKVPPGSLQSETDKPFASTVKMTGAENCVVPVKPAGSLGGDNLGSGPHLVPERSCAVVPAACDRCVTCNHDEFRSCLWAKGEYLVWWLRGTPLPVLVTTGDPQAAHPGALDQSGTSVLYGGHDQDLGTFLGFRLGLGGQLPNSNLGLEASVLFLERRSQVFTVAANQNGFPLLAYPLFFPDKQREGSFLISRPGSGSQVPDAILGHTSFTSSLRMWGSEVNSLVNLWKDSGWRADGLFGFRYLDLDENLYHINVANDLLKDIQEDSIDTFRTRNQFYGGQLGVRLQWACERFNLDFTTKVALGTTHQVVNVDGFTHVAGTGTTVVGTFPGGIYAQVTDMGQQAAEQVTIIPQVQLKGSYDVLKCLRLCLGYEFLCWSSVVRPGDQIDRSVDSRFLSNPGQVPAGATAPQPLFVRSSFWAQGINFGIELLY